MDTHEIMANADTTAQRAWERQFTFVGWQGGWYVLLHRAQGPGTKVEAFRKRVLEWLIEQQITPNIWSRLAGGNSGHWLLLRRAADVLRFQREFGVHGITPKTLFAALRAEANHLPKRTYKADCRSKPQSDFS
jgi:hypothetical protein